MLVRLETAREMCRMDAIDSIVLSILAAYL
jgi:hypothetical protein